MTKEIYKRGAWSTRAIKAFKHKDKRIEELEKTVERLESEQSDLLRRIHWRDDKIKELEAKIKVKDKTIAHLEERTRGYQALQELGRVK